MKFHTEGVKATL